MKRKSDDQLMFQIMADPKYRGKHIVGVKDQVYATKTGPQASKVLEKVINKYPKETPLVAYVSKDDSLILLLK